MPKQSGPMSLLAGAVAAVDAGDLSRERFLQVGAGGQVELFAVVATGAASIRPVTIQQGDDAQYHDLPGTLTLPVGSWGPFLFDAAPKSRFGVAVTALDAGATVTVRARVVNDL